MSGFGALFGAQLATQVTSDEVNARLYEALVYIGQIVANDKSEKSDAVKLELINKIVKEACK